MILVLVIHAYQNCHYYHTIKIDQSFVKNIDSNRMNEKLVQTIIRMAQELEIKTIAEGVETIEERIAVENLGCNYYQGYLYGRPASFDQFTTLYLENTGHAGQLRSATGR